MVTKIFSSGDENLYQVLMSEKELDLLYKTWKQTQNPEDAKNFMDLWVNEVYIPARKKGIFIDPSPSIVKSASQYKPGQKKFSLSGRLKASKKAYKDGKEYYSSPEYKKEIEDALEFMESHDSSKYFKTDSAKKAARKNDKKEISRLKKDMNSPRKLALRDSYHTFKSPYWEDRLQKSYSFMSRLSNIGNTTDINNLEKEIAKKQRAKDFWSGKISYKEAVKGNIKGDIDAFKKNVKVIKNLGKE